MEGGLRIPSRVILVSAGGRTILLDAGLGDLFGPGGTAGRLSTSLADEGYTAEDIEVVIVSHAHPDHIGGLVRMDADRPTVSFPNARVVMWDQEWRFWTDPASLESVS